jgi:hypothetical protein
MRPWHLVCALGLLAGTGATPASAQEPARGPDYWDSVTAAAREMSSALDFFQDTFLTDAGASGGRGLFKQSEQIRFALIYFRQQLGRKVSRDDLYLAFDKVDRSVKALLGEIKGLERWDSGLALAARRLQSADHDLHFALSTGDNGAARITQVIYRQTLALLARVENLDRTARWVYAEQPPLKAWTTDLGEMRQGLVALKSLQDKKAPVEDLRKQLEQVGKVWDRVVARFRGAGDDQYLLQSAVARTDQGFARLAGLFGIKDRRAPLSDNLFN